MITYDVCRELEKLRRRITGIYLTGYTAPGAPTWWWAYINEGMLVSCYISPLLKPNTTGHLPTELYKYVAFPKGLNLEDMDKSKNYELFEDFKKTHRMSC